MATVHLGSSKKKKFKVKGNVKNKIQKKSENFKIINKTDKLICSNKFKLIDLITIISGLSGFGAIFMAFQTAITSKLLYLEYAIVFNLFSIALDIVDGRTARYFSKESLLGKELDSLSDLISFVIAPVTLILMYSYLMLGIHNSLLIGAGLLYIACGVMRLAKFNVNEFEGYYIGLPTTLSAFLIVIIFYFKLNALLWTPILVIFGILMISPIKIKKP
mgnify:FL=1